MNKPIFTTREAASFLGVSISHVQRMVENGELEAWKTSGGHRRIPRAALENLRDGVKAVSPHGHDESRLRVLLVEDDPVQRKLYAEQISMMQLPLDLDICDNGYKALLHISRKPTDLLIVDVVMAGMDGLELIRSVLSSSEFCHSSFAVLTQCSPAEIEARGGLPPGVALLSKPLSLEEMRGFLHAHCAMRERERQMKSSSKTESSTVNPA